MSFQDPAEVQDLLKTRIEALVPLASYTTDMGIEASALWVMNTQPLVIELTPNPIVPLAFWIDDRDQLGSNVRSGVDPDHVVSPCIVRFLYPMRDAHAEGETADWKAAIKAASHLRRWILTNWFDDTDLTIIGDRSRIFNRRIVGDGSMILVEVPLTLIYQLAQ